MVYERRDSSGTAVPTTIAGGISDSDTSFSIADATGWPSGGASGDFFCRIESEIIRCSSRTATTITVANGVAGRGRDGTAAAAHTSGVSCDFIFTRTDLNEANYAVSQTVGKIVAAGDLLIGESANTLVRLAKGANGLPLMAGVSTLSYSQLTGTAIIDNSITFPKLPDIATDRLLGRDTAGSGDIEELTVTNGVEFTDTGGIQRSALTGDVTAAAGSNTTAISNDAVTSAKIAAQAVTSSELSSEVAGDGLAGGNGTPLSVNTDNTTVEKSADALRVKAAGVTLAHLAQEAWTAWAPTIGGTGWAIGNGTTDGAYTRIGNTVHVRARVTFGSGTSFGAGQITVTNLPVNMINDAMPFMSHSCYGIHQANGFKFPFLVIGNPATNATTVGFSTPGLVSTPGDVVLFDVTATLPFTWASTDAIYFQFVYEAA